MMMANKKKQPQICCLISTFELLVLLFGTSQRLPKVDKNLEVRFQNKSINVTISYKYLGVEIDCFLNLNLSLKKNKKMSTRLNLLSKMRQFLTVNAAVNIVKLIILRLFGYC